MALVPSQRLLQQDTEAQHFARVRERVAYARYHYNLALVALAALTEEERRAELHRRKRRWWVRPWIARRPIYGQYEQLMNELRMENPEDFKSFLRVEPNLFFELVQRVGPRIEKSRKVRTPLQPALKLAITLRFLATGNSFRSLEFSFRVAHNTISIFIPEVCQAIIDEYGQEVFVTPRTPDEWRRKAQIFQDRWNFPHACGALDGKHVAIRKPAHSGSMYYNYKGYYSIVMLVLADGEYKALWADVGSPGSESDCGIFNRSELLRSLTTGTIGFPPPEPLPNDDRDTGYFLLGDDAFPLREFMLKPFSHRYLDREEMVCNYRTSRARRVVENLFGIMAKRFRCLLTTLDVEPDRATTISNACLTLHNLLRARYGLAPREADEEDDQNQVMPGAWRTDAVMREVEDLARAPRATAAGQALRSTFKAYFNSDAGCVPWQLRILGFK